jgi:hypothetical protein
MKAEMYQRPFLGCGDSWRPIQLDVGKYQLCPEVFVSMAEYVISAI